MRVSVSRCVMRVTAWFKCARLRARSCTWRTLHQTAHGGEDRVKMAACALRRGLLTTVTSFNKRQAHRILSIVDNSCGFEVTRPRLQCLACGLPNKTQQKRFMSSR